MKVKLSKTQWEAIGKKAGWIKTAEQGDFIIAESLGGGVSIKNQAMGVTENPNFLIVCDYGDWSGFMPLKEALQKLDVLSKQKPDKYFAVVER